MLNSDGYPAVRAAFHADAVAAAESDQLDDEEYGAVYGVDPVVTGPVSASFKQRQAAAHCDRAVWPDIPRACYPD